MLKEQLLAEAQNLDTPVELDSIFESVELSDDAKANFTTVFEQAVKAGALKLAESHITQIAERSDELVEAQVAEKTGEIENKLYEDANKYFDHIAQEWLSENKEAVSRDIKADLFESLVMGMKELFVEHNVVIPEAQVDVVAELEDELTENQQEVKRLFEANQAQAKEIANMKRDTIVSEKTKDLTESQVEKVQNLIEGLEYSDKFESKLTAIVEMVATKAEKTVEESANTQTTTKDDFVPVNENTPPAEKSKINKYVEAAKRLS
ncbi:prohead assembly (scaffolding) protein [Enterobacter phage vB_EcRAM-01]|nr:prohead assembly (scaffolding) protein [Enterobacter phage vB_EcRAM-01]